MVALVRLWRPTGLPGRVGIIFFPCFTFFLNCLKCSKCEVPTQQGHQLMGKQLEGQQSLSALLKAEQRRGGLAFSLSPCRDPGRILHWTSAPDVLVQGAGDEDRPMTSRSPNLVSQAAAGDPAPGWEHPFFTASKGCTSNSCFVLKYLMQTAAGVREDLLCLQCRRISVHHRAEGKVGRFSSWCRSMPWWTRKQSHRPKVSRHNLQRVLLSTS